jgi:acyl-CoA synthetase (AMP-forming)/AMP-acid ligase II/acyl carrier protein
LPFNLKTEGIAALAEWLETEAVTVCGLTGSMFRQFLCQLADTPKAYSSLRFCFVGSESVSKSDVDLYKLRFPDHTILGANMGLNEAGSIRNMLIDKNTEINGSLVPAGYAADDKEIILVNDSGDEVGFDATGEIVVKSDYLSPGYWRRPELTSTKFIVDESDGTRRIYLTGDLGRMSPDGCLYYLGRKDLTVKIRGYNVETPKVEAALVGHPVIKQAAVLPLNRNGDIKLAAYIVPASQPRPSSEQLRRLLTETLPDYMIPSIYVELEALPLTPTGKIDRKALPEPSDTRPQLDVSYVACRNEIEKELIGIWEKVLEVWPIGIHDNFFDLGGHSLTAGQIVSRVCQHFKSQIPLQVLFQSPTVADMAAAIAEHQKRRLANEQLTSILNELESLPDEEAQRLISNSQREDFKS